MNFPKLDESPIINLSASGPYVRHLGSFEDRATLVFDRIRVVSAGGGVQLHEGVSFHFEFDRSEPEVYRLTVEQPFEPDGPSRVPPSAGGYRLRLPWWMLAPMLSAPAGSTIDLEFSTTGVDVYVTPH
jgi:hypothetical protein